MRYKQMIQIQIMKNDCKTKTTTKKNLYKNIFIYIVVITMTIYMNDLEDLKCILETLVFEDEPSIFTEETIDDFVETALVLMDEFIKENPTLISEPDFETIFLEEIKELFYIQFEEQIFNSVDDSVEDDMDEILESVFQMYLFSFCKERSFICKRQR